MKRRKRFRQRRHAAAAVEFAMCVSWLMLLIFGVIEFCGAMRLQHAIREAALEGARVGITLDATTTGVQTQANNILKMIGVTNGTVTVSAVAPPAAVVPLAYTSPSVSVTVSVDPGSNNWWLKFLTAGTPITTTVTLDREIQAISAP